MYAFSDRSKQRMFGVDDLLVAVAYRALEISPIDFGIPALGGKRTADEQFKLFTAGKSKCDGTLKRSKHQDGRALDFYAFVDGSASWDERHLAVVAAAFLQAAGELGVRLEWGGLWRNFKDYPHVQIIKD